MTTSSFNIHLELRWHFGKSLITAKLYHIFQTRPVTEQAQILLVLRLRTLPCIRNEISRSFPSNSSSFHAVQRMTLSLKYQHLHLPTLRLCILCLPPPLQSMVILNPLSWRYPQIRSSYQQQHTRSDFVHISDRRCLVYPLEHLRRHKRGKSRRKQGLFLDLFWGGGRGGKRIIQPKLKVVPIRDIRRGHLACGDNRVADNSCSVGVGELAKHCENM